MATKQPRDLASAYYRSMASRIKKMEKMTLQVYRQQIVPILRQVEKEIVKEAELATNATSPSRFSERIKRLLRQAKDRVSTELSSLNAAVERLFEYETANGLAESFVNQVNITDKRMTNGQISAILGSRRMRSIPAITRLEDQGISSIIQSSINRNTRLIQSIPQQYMTQVQQILLDGIDKGQTAQTIGTSIAQAGGVTERRGQFIARNELGTVYGDLTQKRQENLGIKQFRWITSNDERVRESHRALDGRHFDWDKGAEGFNVAPEVQGLLPGQDFNCRCTSAMVEAEVFALFDRLSGGEGVL